jgi:hypothetical protein
MDAEKLGEPDIKLVGLKIWVHGREFPDMQDYWDGNWLLVTAHCEAAGASIWVSGPIFCAHDLARWLTSSEKMRDGLSGEANLVPLEPELAVEMRMESLGHIIMSVDITPDNLTQSHSFQFELDQSFLTDHINRLKTLLKKFPVRGEPDEV